MNSSASDEPNDIDRASVSIANSKREALLHLFPEARTERSKIDFELLKRALGEVIDTGRERYGLNWPGKAECFKTVQSPSVATLRPAREESINFDTTRNLIIEGDNLEVLKLLQKSYLGRVKLIYIDPPYNTGNDFIYPDNYAESLQTYLQYTGQTDAQGAKFGTNSEADGRFHSKWLSMMYPRLYLARNLLREDGAIFVSIDDHELADLRLLMDQIWGEECFVATIAWQKAFAKKNKAVISGSHDHILVYAKDSLAWARNLLPRDNEQLSAFKNPDSDPRGAWQSVSFNVQTEDAERRKPYRYAIDLPSHRQVNPPLGTHWKRLPDGFKELVKDNRIWFGPDGDSAPRLKVFLTEVQEGIVPDTWWTYDECGHNQEAKKEVLELFNDSEPFGTPKPTRLVRRMLDISTTKDGSDIVLDFFAGSGSTAHAVLDQNASDGGNRRFILVQLPEPTGRSDYPTIAEITKERVRRAIKKLGNTTDAKLKLEGKNGEDRGFRVFKLAPSNFKVWETEVSKDAKTLEQQLSLHVEHLQSGRSEEDFLYEILLRDGYPLTESVERKTIEGKTIYSVASGALVVCLDRVLTLNLMRAIANESPERVVCLDEGFAGNDQLKTNAVQTFKTKNIVFRTV